MTKQLTRLDFLKYGVVQQRKKVKKIQGQIADLYMKLYKEKHILFEKQKEVDEYG